MNKNRILLVVILIYIFVLITLNAYFFIRIEELTKTKITAKASGQIRLCYNHQPVINYTCNSTVDQNQQFYCAVNATDQDGHSITFSLEMLNGSDIFNITPAGVIDFTPNGSQIGNYSFNLTIVDELACINSYETQTFNISVVDLNDPPYLVQPIPNQTWSQDTALSPFDLDSYFDDPDGDPLNYTYTLLSNIQVQIDSSNEVTFIPIAGWYGEEQIIFFAWDPYLANASSNEVTLTVLQTIRPDDPSPPTSGGGGGGGVGGHVPLCLPRWYCRPWERCMPDNLRHRECFDLNNCSSTFGMPNITESCEFSHTCFDGIKAPDEEDIDCGGLCPPCGTCYDNECNNKEDCLLGLTDTPDCGGPCKPCIYDEEETCYDNICNNNEDCTKGLTEIPDCGGPCKACLETEIPKDEERFNWALLFMFILLLLIGSYLLKKSYPYLKKTLATRRRKHYEERLLLETKISESILENLAKIEKLLGKEDIQKIVLLFSTLVRRYFKNLLELSYEFTYVELDSEINSRDISPTFKKVLKKFFDRSLEIEFSGRSVSEHELSAMISEFKEILSLTSLEPIEETEHKKKTKKRMGRIDKMFLTISEAETLLRKGDVNTAYYKYLKLMPQFKNLSGKDKKKIQGFISRLYDEIKLVREEYDKRNNSKLYKE